jgi:hypothetical protein
MKFARKPKYAPNNEARGASVVAPWQAELDKGSLSEQKEQNHCRASNPIAAFRFNDFPLQPLVACLPPSVHLLTWIVR